MLYINGQLATNLTFTNYTQYNATVLFFPPSNFSHVGYNNLTVVNPDGGYVTVVDKMFFTEDCPFVGTFR